MRLEIARNQHPIRTVVSADVAPAELARARRERENFLRRVRRKSNPELRAQEAAYHRARRADPAFREADRERKAAWRKKNRGKVNAYFRNYEALTPGRREYKARWAREKRARDRAAREASA